MYCQRLALRIQSPSVYRSVLSLRVGRIAEMSTEAGHTSADCVKLPQVQATYTSKGDYEDLTGYNTYVTGDKNAKGAVLVIYDIMGISPQILQGADIIASQGYAVYMPDLLRGDIMKEEYRGTSEEAEKMRTEWRARIASTKQKEPMTAIIKELNKRHAGGVAAAGFCWGWRVITDCPESDTLKAIAACHPGGIFAEQGEQIQVPACLLPSEGESMEIMNKIYEGVEKRNPGKNFMKHFDSSSHGWMAARANLEDPKGVKDFTEGYECLLNFFKRYVQ